MKLTQAVGYGGGEDEISMWESAQRILESGRFVGRLAGWTILLHAVSGLSLEDQGIKHFAFSSRCTERVKIGLHTGAGVGGRVPPDTLAGRVASTAHCPQI